MLFIALLFTLNNDHYSELVRELYADTQMTNPC